LQTRHFDARYGECTVEAGGVAGFLGGFGRGGDEGAGDNGATQILGGRAVLRLQTR